MPSRIGFDTRCSATVSQSTSTPLLTGRRLGVPKPIHAAMLTAESLGNLAEPGITSRSPTPREDSDEMLAQDRGYGCDGARALAGWPRGVGAEIGRHPQDAGFRQPGLDVDSRGSD